MALYDLYELDGAISRKPADRRRGIVDDVLRSDGRREPYSGCRLAPVAFGDHACQREIEE